MEKNLAILIADLSGYTAMTETHGSSSAADLVDRFLGFVEDSMGESCSLHQRVGDEVMIVSDSPDCLLSTAVVLMQQSCEQHQFLQLHGGLHYGPLLKRNDSYFGTTLNLTARIASGADPGKICCSGIFLQALKNKEVVKFNSVGLKNFKNISSETEVFELEIPRSSEFFIDPVCKMLIARNHTAYPHPHIDGLYFCSPSCQEIYTLRMASEPGAQS